MQFREEKYEVMEEEGVVRAMVQRSGDVNQQSEVRCYTRQATAKVAQDYEERPDTNASLIFFSPGQWGLCVCYGWGWEEGWAQTPSTALRHPSFGGRCRKAVLGVWGGQCAGSTEQAQWLGGCREVGGGGGGGGGGEGGSTCMCVEMSVRDVRE